jgi:epsilon-lactone hydrolase
MASEEARRFWATMRAQPKDDNPSIEQRRQGDEHAEDLLVEPLAWADMTMSGESTESRAQTDISCSRDGLMELAGYYLAGQDPRHPLASPVFAGYAGMPPILCIVGGDERLIDDSVRVVRAAGMAGVDATLFIAAEMQHVFPIFAGAFPEADAAIRLMGNWIRARTS